MTRVQRNCWQGLRERSHPEIDIKDCRHQLLLQYKGTEVSREELGKLVSSSEAIRTKWSEKWIIV